VNLAKDFIQVQDELARTREELEHFRSLVQAFFTGELPEHATVHHFVMRTWGEKRRETLKPTPVLLKTADPV
jgi:hypothetical protein